MIYTYNDINMRMVKTNVIQFDAVFSEDQTTYLYTHYLIDIQAVVNPMTMAYKGGAGDGVPEIMAGTFPATTIKAIRHTLLQPRKELLIKDEARNILLLTPVSGDTSDARNGPLPIGCHMVNISGARTVLIRWICEGWIRECPDEPDVNTNTPYMIYNRWSDRNLINEYQLTTRTIVGHTIFDRSYLDLDQLTPDYFRNIGIFPLVNPSFQRKSVDIVQNSNGLELDWTITDQEMMWFLGDTSPDASRANPADPTKVDVNGMGSGILEIDGVQTVRSNEPGDGDTGILATGQTLNTISLMATGSFYANQWVMLQRLMQIATGLTPPLMVNQIPTQQAYWFTNASVSRSLGQKVKWVKLDISIRCPSIGVVTEGTGNTNLLPVTDDIYWAMNKVTQGRQSQKISPDLLKDNHTRGSCGLLLLTEALTETCLASEPPEVNVYDNIGDDKPPKEPLEPNTPQTGRTIVPQIPSKYDPEPVGKYPYTTYRHQTDVDTNEGIKQLPKSGPRPTGPDGGGSSGTPGTGGLQVSSSRVQVQQSRNARPGSRRRPSRSATPKTNTASGDYGNGTDNSTCGIVRVHLPITQYVIRFVAERLGQPPMMPSPQPNDPNEFALLSWYLTPFYVVPAPDGVTPIFRIDGEFRYAKVGANSSSDPEILMGKLPFSQFGPVKITKEYFSKNIKGF